MPDKQQHDNKNLEDRAWAEMELLLDQELPRRRAFAWWWWSLAALVLLIGLGLTFHLATGNDDGDAVPHSPSSAVPVAQLDQPHSEQAAPETQQVTTTGQAARPITTDRKQNSSTKTETERSTSTNTVAKQQQHTTSKATASNTPPAHSSESIVETIVTTSVKNTAEEPASVSTSSTPVSPPPTTTVRTLLADVDAIPVQLNEVTYSTRADNFKTKPLQQAPKWSFAAQAGATVAPQPRLGFGLEAGMLANRRLSKGWSLEGGLGMSIQQSSMEGISIDTAIANRVLEDEATAGLGGGGTPGTSLDLGLLETYVNTTWLHARIGLAYRIPKTRFRLQAGLSPNYLLDKSMLIRDTRSFSKTSQSLDAPVPNFTNISPDQFEADLVSAYNDLSTFSQNQLESDNTPSSKYYLGYYLGAGFDISPRLGVDLRYTRGNKNQKLFGGLSATTSTSHYFLGLRYRVGK